MANFGAPDYHDLAPTDNQKTAQHQRSSEGELRVQRVDLLHERDVFRRHRTGQVVHRAPRDPDEFSLPSDAQLVITVDHRFAFVSAKATAAAVLQLFA